MTSQGFRLLDLPEFIFDDILVFVRQSHFYSGHFCYLRLVNRQFNESILRCLCFSKAVFHTTEFFSWHYSSCPREIPLCYLRYCRDFGHANEFYTRIFLQASIQKGHDTNLTLRDYFKALGEALSTLQKEHKASDLFYKIKTPEGLAELDLACGSSSFMFNDPISIILCRSVMILSQTMSCRITECWGLNLSALYDEVHKRNSYFWRSLVICYLYEPDMVDEQYIRTLVTNWSSTTTCDELSDIVTIAAVRGHTPIIKEALKQELIDRKGLLAAIGGACLGNSLEILDLLLAVAPPRDLSSICTHTLIRLFERTEPPQNLMQSIERMVQRIKPAVTGDYCMNRVLSVLVRTNSRLALRQLLVTLQNRRLFPETYRVPRNSPCTTPIWVACINGDMESFRIIIQAGYLLRAPEQDIKTLYKRCLVIAVHSNNLPLCIEICYHMNMTLEELYIEDLAAMDGTDGVISAILDELERPPEQSILRISSASRSPGSVEEALERAAMRLRSANVALLLRRGFRLKKRASKSYFMVEWRHKAKHEDAFAKIQVLLGEYGQQSLEVSF